MEMKKIKKYVRSHSNAKTVAIVGGLQSLVVSTLFVITNPQLRELPIESKIKGIALATGILTLVYTIGFDLIGGMIKKVDNYSNFNKVNNYLIRR